MFARHVMRAMPVRGLTFKRRADGAVEVWRDATEAERLPSYAGPQARRVAIIPANEWASIVSSMSATGEDGMTFNIALAFHNGGSAYDTLAHEHDADSSSYIPPVAPVRPVVHRVFEKSGALARAVRALCADPNCAACRGAGFSDPNEGYEPT